MIKIFDCDKHRWGDCDCRGECRRGAPEMGIMGIDPISRSEPARAVVERIFECNLQTENRCSCNGACKHGRVQIDEVVKYEKIPASERVHEIREYDRYMDVVKKSETEARKRYEEEIYLREKEREMLFFKNKSPF